MRMKVSPIGQLQDFQIVKRRGLTPEEKAEHLAEGLPEGLPHGLDPRVLDEMEIGTTADGQKVLIMPQWFPALQFINTLPAAKGPCEICGIPESDRQMKAGGRVYILCKGCFEASIHEAAESSGTPVERAIAGMDRVRQ